jgi:hypothetical protein
MIEYKVHYKKHAFGHIIANFNSFCKNNFTNYHIVKFSVVMKFYDAKSTFFTVLKNEKWL